MIEESLGLQVSISRRSIRSLIGVRKAEAATMVNPFTYGNPISDPSRFFGRKREIEQVFSRLRNVEFESSSIVGERRIGKTSLLNYVAHPDVRRPHGLDPDKYLFVYVDLQIVDMDTTPTRLWQWLLRQLARCCYHAEVKQTLEELRRAQAIDNFALEEFFDTVDEKGQYVVFLLDEFENVTENENFDLAFFYGLRSLAIHHHLALITSSRHELIELCHSEAIRASPFFNIFANINVRPFTEAEARELIFGSLAGTGVSFSDEEVDNIFQLAGYHPYFLQAACSFLFDAYSRNLNLVEERVSFLRKALREEAAPHLAHYWQNSDEHEKIVLTVLTLLERQGRTNGPGFSIKQLQDLYARSNQTLARLERRGLVVSRGDTYHLFGTSFGEWIWNEITDTRQDHQRYEDWLKSNNSAMEHFMSLTGTVKKALGGILPKIKPEHREMILKWFSEPIFFAIAGKLLYVALTGRVWE
jgi:AAA+ ATPase superfamily predicted ATPase